MKHDKRYAMQWEKPLIKRVIDDINFVTYLSL